METKKQQRIIAEIGGVRKKPKDQPIIHEKKDNKKKQKTTNNRNNRWEGRAKHETKTL